MSGYEAKKLSQYTGPKPVLSASDLLYGIVSGGTRAIRLDWLSEFVDSLSTKLSSITAGTNEDGPYLQLTFSDDTTQAVQLGSIVDPAGSATAVRDLLQLVIGNLLSLNTTHKEDLVGSINEVFTRQMDLEAALPDILINDAATSGADITWSVGKIIGEIQAYKDSILGGAPSAALDTILELGAKLVDEEDAITAINLLLAAMVRFDIVQTLTALQQAQARSNIGAAAQSDVDANTLALNSRVRTDTATQGLTPTEAGNARANMGLGAASTATNTDQISEGVLNFFYTAAREATAKNRSNHTGTQLAATISDLAAAVAIHAPVASVNSRTGPVVVAEAIIENFQGFIGTDCLEDPTKSPCSIVTANATLSVRPNGNGMADAIGVWRWVGTGAADISCGAFFSGGSGALFTLTAEPVVLIASFSKTSSLSKERVVVGAYTTSLNGDTSFGGDVNNGFCVSLDDGVGAGQWNFRTTAGGITTNAGTLGATPVADDTRYTCVIVATNTSIKFYVNGTLRATHTTNIPTGGLHVGVGMYQVAGGAFQGGTFSLDLLRFGRVYKTTPRNLGIPAVTY
ncbi:MAG TPA: hypothetical protein VFW42_02295 [Fluviicoccus sp.]|nr:hypothetical protein [Fluviicoccus sp.]